MIKKSPFAAIIALYRAFLKQPSTVEWYVAESDADWAAQTSPAEPEREPGRERLVSSWFYWGMITLFVLLVSAVGWYTTHSPLYQDKADITVPTPMAMESNGSRTYSEIQQRKRFYGHSARDWQQTTTDGAEWGPELSLVTPYFLYHFRQHDTQVVSKVAPEIDGLYMTLWHNWGLDAHASPPKLVIDVSLSQAPGSLLSHVSAPEPILVPSPSLYAVIGKFSDGELLAQSIVLPLLERGMGQAKEHYAVRTDWLLLLRGFYLWQLWNLDLPLAAWRQDVVRWLYVDLPKADPEQPVVLPERYMALCATHALWLASPTQINIPLLCAGQKWERSNLASWSTRTAPTQLKQLGVPMAELDPSVGGYGGRIVALSTLIEYAADTYGREHLPALVAGLGQYDSWETLIPAVFGVSVTEFEAGWQAYLKTHYGIRSAN